MVTRTLLSVLMLLAACGCGGTQLGSADLEPQPVASEAGTAGIIQPPSSEAGASTVTGTAAADTNAALEAATGQGGAPPVTVGQGGSPASAWTADVLAGAPNGGSGVAGSAGAAPAIGGQSGSPAGGSTNSVAGGGGAAGAPATGFGTVVVTWTVGGVATNPTTATNQEVCACFNQYGDKLAGGFSHVVLSYGLPGKPRDSGAAAVCGELNLSKDSVPSVDLSFMVRLERAFTENSLYNSESPDYELDPAVTFTATVTANQTTHIVVDFPAVGAAGATFSIAP